MVKNIGVVIVVAIVFLAIGSGGIYYLKQSEIADLESELKENEENKNDEFVRFLLLARSEIDNAFFNLGSAIAYEYEAQYFYDLEIYELAEIYYTLAQENYGFVTSGFGTADALLKQAKNYSNSDKTLEYISKYIDFNSYSEDINDLYYQISESKRLACYYYNLSEWDAGHIHVEKSNANLDELNKFVSERNNLLTEIDILLETSWR